MSEEKLSLQNVVNNAVQAARNERLKDSPQLTLGELILKLKALNKPDEDVCFDFERATPTCLSSWRGSYCELAIRFDFESNPHTVAKFIDLLEEAVGKTYTGYKGGDFVMGKRTPVWVANYGHSGNTAVVDVLDTRYRIIIKTEYCEYS